MDPKFGDLKKVEIEVVVPRFDGESLQLAIISLSLRSPMRRISTQGVWWHYTHEQTVPMQLGLLSPNYDTLPFQDDIWISHLPNLTATN